MTGQLHEHPLAELLHEIDAAGLSGALRLEHERVKTVVYLADGEIVYAVSNLRQHRLSECVRRWQALSVEELPSLPTDAPDLDFAAALIEANVLSHEALEALQERQLTEVLRPILLWTDGTWEFDARVRISGDVRVSIAVRNLLMEGARRLPAEFAASRFSDPEEILSPAQSVTANVELLPTEAFVLSRIGAPLKLDELIAVSTLPETELKQIVYTLALGGLLERERWPRAFSPEMLARARSVKATPVSVSRPAAREQQEEAASAPIPEVTVKTEVVEESGVDELFARLAVASDYYQVLGVRRTAQVADIKSSYHKLAKRFHPDRFHRDADATLHVKIEEAFARIAQAYETLKDKQSRATYDLKLSQQSAAARAGSAAAQPTIKDDSGAGTMPKERAAGATAHNEAFLLRAENAFQRGLLALKQSKMTSAIAAFGEAVGLIPKEARYRAHYGQALSHNDGMRRQAEAELKAAIALDSSNVSYHVMLAEFYVKLGLPRRAQSELERALLIEPHHAAARRLLENLKGRD